MVMDKIRKLILFMLVFILIATVGQIAYYSYYNINLTRNFHKCEGAYDYVNAVKQEKIDLNEISNLFTDIVALIGYPDFQNEIISPVKIEYYKNIRDKSPVYVIEKGEIINFEMFPKTKSGLQFRGNDSIPTNEEGWRLARPFRVDGENKDALWYVNLEDLICVSNEWLKENPTFAKAAPREMMRRGLLPTKRNISKFMLLFVDRELYSEGIYLSKDMYRPIIDNTVLISFFATIILFVMHILGKKFRW